MLGNLTSHPLSIPIHKMEPIPINQTGVTSSVSTNPASLGVVKKAEMVPTRSNLGLQTSLLPTKRKAAAEISVPNKRVVHMEAHVNSPRLSQQSSFSNKKMVRNESMSNRIVSPRVQASKSKTAPPEVSPKVQNESYEAVRMKMRETLAAALSVGNQDKENVPGKDRSKEAGKSTAGNQDSEQKGKDEGQKPLYNYAIPDTDGAFDNTLFIKDELLQGNGLSWAWDMEVTELKEEQKGENSNLEGKNVSGNGMEQVISCPQELAFNIEAELFKLFGGVNKKYKEKGRSLMFNLKDRNNPELREKVLSSKISPERLCSMTPEELASKELSEWRTAKAEELDKMIVLPDSDVDMNRLVKKTHKGEYQVEVDQDDGVSVEVSVGSNSFTRFQKKTRKDNLPSSVSEVVNVSMDATDLMQELNVDEFKDEGFLPPIVSLNEFMDSLDSEPPFENLPVDVKEMKDQSDKNTSEIDGEGNEKVFSAAISANNVNNNLNVETMEAERKALRSPISAPIGDCLWEGELQLTLSSVVPVIGLFRSGEKTSAKEWPGSIEIKGRVRLEAFEKFLQELPLSRTRAVMVVHFLLKDASSEHNRASLSEAVDSYVADERVGFGEPNEGVELYFCPPHKRITETLSRLLSKDQTDGVLGSTENMLIGVVVWRRAQPSSAMLPNSSSRHKHNRKHLSSRRQENLNSNTNSNTRKSFNHDDSVDDDVPPGFGPGVVARNEDDLPEFSFSKGSNSFGQTLPAQSGSGPMTPRPRPVAQMRHLVYEYGQTGINTSRNGNRVGGIETKPWNQDDDDDIPEWKPQLQNSQEPKGPNHDTFVNQVRPAIGQTPSPVMPIQPPFNLMQNGWVPPIILGNGWVQPLTPHGLPPNAAVPGQFYGGQWRQDDPRGRGF